MPIENDDECFALLCSRLDIPDITLLVTVPDDEIRARCELAELAQLVIELKQETLRQLAHM